MQTSATTLCWSPVSLAVLARYAACWQREGTVSADYTPANLFAWDNTYHQSIAFVGDRATVRITEDGVNFRYLFPVGTGDPTLAIEALLAEAKATAQPLVLVGVTEEQLATLSPALLARFSIEETRDFADYLYSAEALASLAGKKLHGKRNHVNAFSAAHRWQAEPLTPVLFPHCREILAAWQAESEFPDHGEQDAILRALAAWSELSLSGAVLFADGKPVAFTVGEMIGEDTLCVHFEKAMPAWRGAYPVINREFVRMMREKHPVLALINREDDMGLPNLRAAKLSYHPLQFVKKFCLRASDL